jgi:hypothetical protein
MLKHAKQVPAPSLTIATLHGPEANNIPIKVANQEKRISKRSGKLCAHKCPEHSSTAIFASSSMISTQTQQIMSTSKELDTICSYFKPYSVLGPCCLCLVVAVALSKNEGFVVSIKAHNITIWYNLIGIVIEHSFLCK